MRSGSYYINNKGRVNRGTKKKSIIILRYMYLSIIILRYMYLYMYQYLTWWRH